MNKQTLMRLLDSGARIANIIHVPSMLIAMENPPASVSNVIEENYEAIAAMYGINFMVDEDEQDFTLQLHEYLQEHPGPEWLIEYHLPVPYNVHKNDVGDFVYTTYGWGMYHSHIAGVDSFEDIAAVAEAKNMEILAQVMNAENADAQS